jgi:hypothetical protein
MSFIPSSTGAAASSSAGLLSFAPYLLAGSSFLGGLSKRKASRETARIERETGIDELVRSQFQERGMKLEQDELLSTIRNRAAGAGLDASQGSPLEAYLQASRETELDIVNARNTAERQFQARMDRAKLLTRGGDASMLGSLLEGAGDLTRFQMLKDKYSFRG